MLSPLLQMPWQIAAMLAVMMVALAALGFVMRQMLNGRQARAKRRLAAVVGRGSGEEARAERSDKKRSVQDRLKQLEKARQQTRGYKLREQLRLAGLSFDVSRYLAGCAVLFALTMIGVKLTGLSWMAALLIATTVGIGLPKVIVGRLAKRRVKRFSSQFADAIDIIVRGIRTGLPLGECLSIIAREMAYPLGGEFRQIVEETKFGMPLSEALDRAVTRMPIAEFRYFGIVIAIQQQTGGNLAETLAKLSETLRARKRMRDKVQAYAAEARTTAYIIGSLPLLVILVLSAMSPQYISILFTNDTGNFILLVGAVTQASGLWVMNRMINFDI